MYNRCLKRQVYSTDYVLVKFRAKSKEAQEAFTTNNPYYFTGLSSAVVVLPAAYNFVIDLMSSHGIGQPAEHLDSYDFQSKSFFSVIGESDSLQCLPGQGRVLKYRMRHLLLALVTSRWSLMT